MKHNIRRAVYVLALICLLPMALSVLAASLASIFGCELSEAGTGPCEVFGLEIGGTLSSLFLLGGLALFSMPVLIAVLALWGTYEAASYWRGKRREESSDKNKAERV